MQIISLNQCLEANWDLMEVLMMTNDDCCVDGQC